MTIPAIAPAESDAEPPEWLGAVVSERGEVDAEELEVDELSADELIVDVEVAIAPRNVCASVSMPISPAQQSFVSPQHHLVEFAVSSQGVIKTLLLTYHVLVG